MLMRFSMKVTSSEVSLPKNVNDFETFLFIFYLTNYRFNILVGLLVRCFDQASKR